MDTDMKDFTWAVDSAIWSDTDSSFGASPVRSFASVVNNAIRSSTTASNLGASRGSSFASVVSWNRTGTEHVATRVFTLAELRAATNNFSSENEIGAANFAVVYRGTLVNGNKVAIKKCENIWFSLYAFNSDLAFLSHRYHKNLVRLVGFCREKGDNKFLVYEYMKNRSLNYHLHDNKGSISMLDCWKMRIKIALDVSQGIEYLHNYAPLSSIHNHIIKSSNILFDDTWTAKVSDFRLWSLMSPKSDSNCTSMEEEAERETETSFAYIYSNPEYFCLNAVSPQSDVYRFGVVLLELLTGKTVIFKSREDIGTPLVSFAVPAILAGELMKILDPRVGLPNMDEAEALKLVAFAAVHCVNLNEKDRPTMTNIVVILEQALDICDTISFDIF